ncbi:hypothetical protein KAFR_0A05480 [Kazachstania africana CBS 2517]|uniref:TLC domain-containing protein n=1 Tax=Kazachstania africana (strain ATCC 22294 / BCRC 22015 / CBS 2517 / CECT 1963 / NBRC 1671 / NRRL Y-8276) TaxID=1071382 RepID=H2ANN3_KAZAF|nr:hypothetical protein KAFR_0A05480 [Kazachstania africana CBS 2517]CCF55983.1 hypothetical protein KAFR_0A05480 [Kazachstania africana CBS 2517]
MQSLIDFLLNLPQPVFFKTTLIPLLETNGFVESRSILNNLHSILYIALFYQTAFLFSIWFLFPPHVNRKFKDEKDDEKKRHNLVIQSGIHFISFLQTVVVLYLSIGILKQREMLSIRYPSSEERIFGENRDTQTVCLFALGYFIWDICISAVYSTLPFVLHGVVSTIVYFIGLKPYLQYYAPVFLIFEISNPFLNFRWFGLKYVPNWDKTLLFNNLILMITFFLGRIAWGWYQIAVLCIDFYNVRNMPQYRPLDTWIIVIGNLILDVLNVVWFSSMVSVAIKVIKGKNDQAKNST